MTSVLITGASGSIGTALCKQLESSSHDATGIDTHEPRFEHNVPVETCDLRSNPSLPTADVIVHLAAHARVPPVLDDPTLAFENVSLLEPVLEHARRTNAHLIFASSREVYGDTINASESEVSQTQPNPYGASKLAGEVLVSSYRETYDVSTTVIRLSNVYGPYDHNTRVLPIFIALADAGERLTVYDGRKILDFVHIDTVTEVTKNIIEQQRVFDGEVVNVGSGRGTPLTDLAQRVVDEVVDCPGYKVVDGQGDETTRYVPNIDRLRALFDVSPKPLKNQLPDTVAWYRNRPDLLSDIRMKLS